MEIPEGVLQNIQELPKPAIIAISGFGGAGKTTTADALAEALNAPVICIDRFAIDRTVEDYSHWNGMDFARFEQEVLIPFSQGKNPLAYGHWDHGANTVVKTVEVPHSDVLIVEGVGLFRPELLKYFGYKIWVNCPQEIANARGKKRDREVHKNPQDEKWDGLWKRNDGEYFDAFKPKDQADFVLDNCS